MLFWQVGKSVRCWNFDFIIQLICGACYCLIFFFRDYWSNDTLLEGTFDWGNVLGGVQSNVALLKADLNKRDELQEKIG